MLEDQTGVAIIGPCIPPPGEDELETWQTLKASFPFCIVLCKIVENFVTFEGDASIVASHMTLHLKPGPALYCFFPEWYLPPTLRILSKGGYFVALFDHEGLFFT